jgi:hypothetical protein
MSRRGLLVVAAALAVWAAWTVYAQGTGPSTKSTPNATQQCAGCTKPSCDPAGCCGGCPAFVDGNDDGVCDMAGTCTKHTNGNCPACPAFVDQDKDGVCDRAGTCCKRASGARCGQNGCRGL